MSSLWSAKFSVAIAQSLAFALVRGLLRLSRCGPVRSFPAYPGRGIRADLYPQLCADSGMGTIKEMKEGHDEREKRCKNER